MDNPLIPIPLDDRLTNQHLYTCRKEGKREPLICSVAEGLKPMQSSYNLLSDSVLHEYGYSLQGVFDSSQKTDTDWSLRRFDSIVSHIKFCSTSNL